MLHKFYARRPCSACHRYGIIARTLAEGKKGIIIGKLIAIPVVIMAALCGIIAKYKFPGINSWHPASLLFLAVVPPFVAVLIRRVGLAHESGSPFLMGATTLAVKGYLAPFFKIENDRRVLLVSRLTTLAIGGLSLILGFWLGRSCARSPGSLFF